MIVADTDRPFEKRGLEFDTTVLPVPADLLVYKQSEWEAMLKKPGGFPDSVQLRKRSGFTPKRLI